MCGGIVGGGAQQALAEEAAAVGCSRLLLLLPCFQMWFNSCNQMCTTNLRRQLRVAPTWAAAMAFSQAGSSTSRSLKSSGPI